jgi:hypothetical protein
MLSATVSHYPINLSGLHSDCLELDQNEINQVMLSGTMAAFHFRLGAFEPLAKFVRFDSGNHLFSGLTMHVEQLLQFLVMGNNPFILFIAASNPFAATFLRIGVKLGQILMDQSIPLENKVAQPFLLLSHEIGISIYAKPNTDEYLVERQFGLRLCGCPVKVLMKLVYEVAHGFGSQLFYPLRVLLM